MIWHERKYRDIAKRLMRTLPEFEELRDACPRVAYLKSSKAKVKNRRIFFAECCKVDEKYSWCCPYDFFIVVYVPNVEDFSEEQLVMLIRHELHHIGIEYTDNGIEFYTKPHDVEEFWEIIKDCVLNWNLDNMK